MINIMKKTILISILLLSCTLFYGQGTSYNLGFSQVLNLNFSVSYTPSDSYKFTNVGTLTVPNNKIYKITNGSSYYTNNDGKNYFATSMKVGEHVLHESTTSSANSAVYGPVWLSAGTYNVFVRFVSNSTGSLNAALSIVEFNIE